MDLDLTQYAIVLRKMKRNYMKESKLEDRIFFQ